MSVPDPDAHEPDRETESGTSDFRFAPAAEPYRPAHGLGVGEADQAASRSSRKLWLVWGVVAAVLLIAGGGVAVWAVKSSSGEKPAAQATDMPLVAAQKECAPGSAYAELGDAGKSLNVSGEGQQDLGLSMGDLTCILQALKTPDSVIAEMDSTRALDGRQTAQWGNIHASWTFHPDHGLHIILTAS